jgi:hypothetical protein
MMGRPSLYTEEIAEEICARLPEGESLLAMCRDPGMPSISTVFLWLTKHVDFSDNYVRAREIQGHTHAAMAIEKAVNARDAALGRLAYDALKWHASKLVPKVYGDKTEVDVAGPNGGPAQVERVIVPTNDPIEAARVYQKFMSGDG